VKVQVFFIKEIYYYHEDTDYTLQQQDVKDIKNAHNQEKNKKVKNRKQKPRRGDDTLATVVL
jgi:hypothetical protein